MFSSIQRRIAIPFTILILVSMNALGFYLVGFVRDVHLNDLRFHLEKEAKLAAEIVVASSNNQVNLDALTKSMGRQADSRITIIAQDGTVLGDSKENPLAMENHATRPEVMAALASGIGESTRYSTTVGQHMMYVAVPISKGREILGIARVALPLAAIERSVNHVATSIILAMALITLTAIVAAILIARRTTRPLKQLTQAAQRMASGDLDQKIQAQTRDEVGQLARAFNEMSLSLKAQITTISHERTKLESILAGMADGVIMTDNEGNIVLVNRAAGALFGVKQDAVIGQPLIQVVRDHELYELLKSCLETAEAQTAQLESRVAQRFLRVVGVRLRGEKLSGAIIVFQDLTELRHLQTMRRELVANISHELRTPLAVIKALAETLREGAEDEATSQDFLSRIDAEVSRMTQMVSELTELSRIESGGAALEMGPVDLNSIVEAVVARLDPQAERQGVALSSELPAELPALQVDKDRVQQVVTNLVHNAIKFTPSGGTVIISAKLQPGWVVVSVSDTGIGISREDLPHVFERFYKADRARTGEGTGLGLAIAKHVVEGHGGRIWAESVSGKGSTFNFTLPLAAAPQLKSSKI